MLRAKTGYITLVKKVHYASSLKFADVETLIGLKINEEIARGIKTNRMLKCLTWYFLEKHLGVRSPKP